MMYKTTLLLRGLSLALGLLGFLSSAPVWAQAARTVSGTVTSTSDGQGLPGVTVIVKGTAQGTTSDLDGKYQIQTTDNATLVFSSIGFTSQEIPVNGRATLDVALAEDTKQLNEVIVVGYGTQKKSDLTGSVASVSSEEIQAIPTPRPDQAIQGRVPGVQVATTSAHPGGTVQIRIRGGNSLQGSNNPLVVIDGMLGGDLQLLNPNDIASVEVLKDASATAIYGSRGANGVIIVTTKQGQAGKVQIDVSSFYGWQQITKKLDMLNAQQHAELLLANPLRPYTPNDPASYGTGTDWQDQIFQVAPMQSYQLSASGGSEKTRFLVSGNFYDQDGVIKNSNFQRGTFRLNLTQTVNDRLRFGNNITYSRSVNNLVKMNDGYGSQGSPVTMSALRFSPLIAPYDADGTYSPSLLPGDQLDNPLLILSDRIDRRTRNYLLGNAFAEYKILNDLIYKLNFGYILDEDLSERYDSRRLQSALNAGQATIANGRNTNWLLEHTLTYQHTFNQRHDLSGVAGFTAQGIRDVYNRTGGSGFPSDILTYKNLSLASTPLTPASNYTKQTLASFLGRINYSYDSRYLLTLSGRADGSSKFAANNKWAFFPSAALGWRISEEQFMQHIAAVSNLKVRLSYGITGSQAISPYQSLASFNLGSRYTLGTTTYTNGVQPGRVPNPDLKWETTGQTNVGFDLGLFNNRIDLTADYYDKKTYDLHYSKLLPTYTGYTSQVQNIGSMRNRGLELGLTTRNLIGPFTWTTSANISWNRNEVLELGDDTEFPLNASGGAMGAGFSQTGIIRVGEPVGNFWGYVFDGIFQNEAEADALAQSGAKPGTVRYKDLNQDGKIDNDDKTIIGNALPQYVFGITNQFSYKGFDLSIFLQGVQGNDVLNLNRFYLESVGGSNNALATTLNYWRGEGTSNTIQAPGESPGEMSTRFVEDGSYVRLRNLVLGYNLPNTVSDKLHLRQLRVYVSAQNLFTWTNYTGYDPEVNSRGGSGSTSSENLELGYDNGGYPGVKTYTVGLNLSF
ncbi:TonB-linked outer membrane protein, SusC/RagA family [Catalinimonas alkaloidigena]|uniref:TonB-linked outer membrane protein, SusC/RagA family n=1 Tax=Catalinimonas alkaloidigena TaxID=1075417 RepID=A0A1G9HH72_9BACT|nr:TonB-dependent receptor [Catalinimonas alkaloidigena]SDL12348.1 TonB-linked outer membrane protein, SusC/RagA family [Catalinimonas alkaloidigena]